MGPGRTVGVTHYGWPSRSRCAVAHSKERQDPQKDVLRFFHIPQSGGCRPEDKEYKKTKPPRIGDTGSLVEEILFLCQLANFDGNDTAGQVVTSFSSTVLH